MFYGGGCMETITAQHIRQKVSEEMNKYGLVMTNLNFW